MQPGLWTSLIMMIPGVRAAYAVAEEKRLAAAHFQGQILAMQSRLDQLTVERIELQRAKDDAYKLAINIMSQYQWGVKQYEDVGGMPAQFQPQGGAMPSDSINASALIGRGNKDAIEEFLRVSMENDEYERAGSH